MFPSPHQWNKLTLCSCTASPRVEKLWFRCCFASRHSKHTSCLSCQQKTLSFLLWRAQRLSAPSEHLSLFSFTRDSHRFFSVRLVKGSSWCEEIALQIGHSLDGLVLQNCCTQALQMLWVQVRMTGSLKMSQHTGQWRSASIFDAIVFFPVKSWDKLQKQLFRASNPLYI